MSDLPPTIDAILASIRARVTGDDRDAEAVPPAERPAPVAAPPTLAAIGRVELPAATGALTLDALIRQMLEPMLKAWLDANMPDIVERLAQAEIKRLTTPERIDPERDDDA